MQIAADDLRRIERLHVRAWPAFETANIDGWLWRYSGGGSQRANAVSTIDFTGAEVEHAVDEVESRYHAIGAVNFCGPAVRRLPIPKHHSPRSRLRSYRGSQSRIGTRRLTRPAALPMTGHPPRHTGTRTPAGSLHAGASVLFIRPKNYAQRAARFQAELVDDMHGLECGDDAGAVVVAEQRTEIEIQQ